jgi:diketogulonate reductase-like aldo/keto reductase
VTPQFTTPQFIYGTAWKEESTAELTALALQSGFRAIDTANQRKHYFEAKVGEALREAYRAGTITRDDVFLQTKYTYQSGQDHRLPYDPSATFSEQVAQSMASSLEHLGSDYVDSYLLHGPASGYGWTESDAEVWTAILRERDAGRTRHAGVSNVSVKHLEQMAESGAELPRFVQNRCYARLRWDRAVRMFCAAHGIVYQGFSLLTANQQVLAHPLIGGIARRHGAGIAQVIFRFAMSIGILPLTGTSSAEHMRQDLASKSLQLSDEEIQSIEAVG